MPTNICLPNMLTCRHCGIELPLREPGRGERAEPWECTNCGAYQAAVYDDAARDSLRTNARPLTHHLF